MVELRAHAMFYASLGLIVVAITLTQVTAFYYSQQPNDYKPRSGCSYSVCALINFGNSTSVWYNETTMPATDFYNLTVIITHGNLQAEYYPPPLNEHFVTSIEGVQNQGQFSWTLWSYCDNQRAWVFSSVGADEIELTSGVILAWAYEISSSHSPPITGAATATSCS